MNKGSFLHNFFAGSSFEEHTLTHDLSLRYYSRISSQDKSFILMRSDYPEEEKFAEFIKLTKILRKLGFIAPKIYASDIKLGLILEEDLGNNILNKHLENKQDQEIEFYLKTIEILKKLKNIKFEQKYNLPSHSDEIFLQGIEQFIKYLNLNKNEGSYLLEYFQGELQKLTHDRETFSLQDFHADNLIITKENDIALLDYQDAMWSFAAYDVVSFLYDARRYVSNNLREECLKNFTADIKNKEQFLESVKIIALQHNLRVFSLFIKVQVERNLIKYKQYLPTVAKYIAKLCDEVSDRKLVRIIDKHQEYLL